MSDRDLLEAAARAAGVQGEWARWHQSYGDEWVEGINTGGRLLWNPLADDGDALRLAVKLLIEVYYFLAEVQAKHDDCAPVFELFSEHADPYAATRRAIVRAAALTQPEGGA